MKTTEEKKDHFTADKRDYFESLGTFQKVVDHAMSEIKKNQILHRIESHDHTVWKDDPAEISNRLGWLQSPDVMPKAIDRITFFVDEVRTAGYTHALLLGMGGSSLAPEVFRNTFGVKDGYLDLSVLDSTDPGAILEKAKALDPSKTLFLVSTKSGGTVETLSFLKYFYNKTLKAVGKDHARDQFIAITDPDSGLETLAKQLRFRKIFLNDPHIGGRYSALTYFGLVPAALIGMDLHLILKRAAIMAEKCRAPEKEHHTALRLGAAIGELAIAGRDKVTFIISPPLSPFGAWVEQLIAESTGKDQKGILPVTGEAVVSPEMYGNDRLFVYLRIKGDPTYDQKVQALIDDGRLLIQLNLEDPYDLGGEFFRWEMATVIAGMRLHINPFDQPNVESAKVLAREMVSAYQTKGSLPDLTPTLDTDGMQVYSDSAPSGIGDALQGFLSQANPGREETEKRSYVAIQAYIQPTPAHDAALHELRTEIQTTYRLAVTVGYGPRFLHSTGQLHKGDAGNGLFIQFTADMAQDLPIPDQPGDDKSFITFGVLKNAQALGDRQALIDAGRHVIRFDLGKDISGNLKKLTAGLR